MTPKNLWVDTFPDPVGHFGAGVERVPPSPLGWYWTHLSEWSLKLLIGQEKKLKLKLTAMGTILGISSYHPCERKMEGLIPKMAAVVKVPPVQSTIQTKLN